MIKNTTYKWQFIHPIPDENGQEYGIEFSLYTEKEYNRWKPYLDHVEKRFLDQRKKNQ